MRLVIVDLEGQAFEVELEGPLDDLLDDLRTHPLVQAMLIEAILDAAKEAKEAHR